MYIHRGSEAAPLRLVAAAPLPRIFFSLVLSGGATIAFLFETVSSALSWIFWRFLVSFSARRVPLEPQGCPLTSEAARVSFLDAFWWHLELLLGGLGGHFCSLFGASVVVCFWSGFRAGFCPIWAPFWIICWSCFGAFWGPGRKVPLRLSLKRGLHFEGPEGIWREPFCGAFLEAVSEPSFVRFWVPKQVHYGHTFSHLLCEVF